MINLTADIDTEKAKRNLEGLKQSAKRVVSGMINDFELLDSAVFRFNKTLGGVGGNFHIPALSAKIKQAQNEFNKLEGVIMTPNLTESASKEVNAFIASLEQLEKVLTGLPERVNSFDAIASSMRDLVAQADIFINKIGQIQQSAIPIPSKTPAQSAPLSGSTQTSAPMMEAASYRELLRELQAVSGTKLQLIGQIEALKTKNKEYKTIVDAVNKSENDGMRISQERASQRRNASLAIEQNKVLIQSLQRELKEQIKVEQAVETSINDLTASLKRMQTVYSQLDAEQRQSPFGQNLYKNIEELEQRINGVGVAMQTQTQKVGYYASGFNGLSFQIQQVARELPSLAYGPQVFFGAISNNLPMLTDEITRARAQYNELIKSGQKATPVWKQMLSSLVSWQTVLIAGITVLTLYGKEIVNWTASLFKGRKEIDSAKIALEQFHATMTQGTIAAQEEITKLDLLYRAATDAAKPYEERKKAVERLQEIYPAYFGNMDSEMVMAGQLKGKYDELKASIIEVAQARAASNQITELQGQKITIEQTSGYQQLLGTRKQYDALLTRGRLKGQTDEEFTGILQSYVEALDAAQKVAEETLKRNNKDLYEKIKESGVKYYTEYVDSIDEQSKNLSSVAEKQYTLNAIDEKNVTIIGDQELKSLLKKLTMDAQQAEIDAMAEGTEKRVAQIELDYKKREEAIKEGEANILKLQEEITPEQQSQIQSLRYANEKIRKAERHKAIAGKPANIDLSKDFEDDIKAWEDYYEKYGAFRERLQATKDKYDRKLSEAKNEGERASIQAEYDATVAEFEVQASAWAKELTDLAVRELEHLMVQTEGELEAAKKAFDALNDSTSPESQQLLATINKLQARIKVLEEQINKTKKAVSDDDWAKGALALNAIADGAREALNGIKSLDGGLVDVLEALVNVSGAAGSLASSIAAIGKGDKSFANIASTITSGIGLISSGLSLFSKAWEADLRHQQALTDIMNSRIAQQREYNLLLMEQNLEYERGITIFGTDEYGKAMNAINAYKDARRQLNETVTGTKQSQSTSKGASIMDDLMNSLFGIQNPEEGLAGVKIVTGHKKTGLFGWGKGRDVYSSILDVYPELVSENGEFNKELAQTIINTRKMSDSSKDALQNMIDLANNAEDAMQTVNDYLTGIFGDLGSSLTDALVESFESGTDAAEAFGDAVGDMLKNIARQVLYSATLAPLIDEAQAKIEEINKNSALSDEDRFNGYAGVIGNLMDQVLAEQESGQDLWERLQKMAEEKGIDWTDKNASGQTATSRGFQAMSQDTGNELNGRFTDMQGKMNILVSGMDMLRSINMDTRNTTIDIRDIMIQLNGNVADIRTYTRVLPAMSDTLTSMNKKLDNL